MPAGVGGPETVNRAVREALSMAEDGAGPAAVEVVVVTATDVVTAYETNLTTERDAGIRLTPPFRARMRGRLHRVGATGAHARGAPEAPASTRPVTIPPDALLADPPARPRPAETAADLRAVDAEYTRERHRDRHVEAMVAWREAVAAAIADRVAVETSTGVIDARVATLGDGDGDAVGSG